jgi:hypothetical protein
MSNFNLAEDAVFTILETADIGGTNTGATGNWATYLSMAGFDRVDGVFELGTWDSSDDLDTCKFQQATDSSGTSVKDLTTSASGGNYDTDNPVDADGNTVHFSIRAEDLDTDNGFTHVRAYLAEAGNSGVDNVSGVIVRYAAANKRKELAGDASSGATVYVTPRS